MAIATHHNNGLSAIWLNLLHIEQMKNDTVNVFGQFMSPPEGQEFWNVFLAATACKEGWDKSVYIRIQSNLSSYKIQLTSDIQGWNATVSKTII